MAYPQQLASGQANAEVIINRNAAALAALAFGSKNEATSSGLTWGYWGGRWGGTVVADGTLALTASATNYIVANRSSGAISVSTASTNWSDSDNYARLYKVSTGSSSISGTPEDHRAGPKGLFGIPQPTSSGGETGTGTSSYSGYQVHATPSAAAFSVSSGVQNSPGYAFAIPISVSGPMKLKGVSYNCSATGSGSVEWGLFSTISPSAASKIAGGSAVISATGNGIIDADGSPVDIQPGQYILILFLPSTGNPSLMRNELSNISGCAQKYKVSYTWSDTPDLTTGWITDASVLSVSLVGKLNSTVDWW